MHKKKIRKDRSFFGALRANTNRAVKGVQDESGSVESALVLIPLLILFLLSLQIGVAINFRNIDRAFVQSDASERATSGEYISSDRALNIDSFGPFNSISILVAKKVSSIPVLVPFIGSFINRARHSDVTGIAVVEELP